MPELTTEKPADRFLADLALLLQKEETALNEDRFEEFFFLARNFRNHLGRLGQVLAEVPFERRADYLSLLLEINRRNDELENKLKQRLLTVKDKLKKLNRRRKARLFYAPARINVASLIDHQV